MLSILERAARHALYVHFGTLRHGFFTVTKTRIRHGDMDTKIINGQQYIYMPSRTLNIDARKGTRVDFIHPKHHTLQSGDCFKVLWNRCDEKDRHIIGKLLPWDGFKMTV